MLSGENGRKSNNLVKITWAQFQTWQRWDEYPEQKNNPPMTVDMTFWYEGNKYYLDNVNHEYAILNDNWKIVAADSNFLSLLTQTINEWGGKSFREVIGEMLFEN